MGEIGYRDRRYRDDTVFNMINKMYLTLDDADRKVNNEHLKTIIELTFIPLMRQDELFNLLYKRIMYGGSYYKGTRYGAPTEFDLDFILKLPIDYELIEIDTDHHNYGFVKIKVNRQGQMHHNWEKHSRTLNSWFTADNYFDQDKFSRWMQNIVEGSLRKLSNNNSLTGNYTLIYNNEHRYEIRYTRSGPAFTMIINTANTRIDIDIVPCLEFSNELGNGYRRINQIRKTWMVVAKPLPSIQNGTILWRLCFYEQEKMFLEGDLKPVIRMMKKFRDTCDWKCIASYYIETIFYHELENNRDNLSGYLRAPKTWLFMNGLKKLKEAFSAHHLSYFWHPKYNLLEKISKTQLTIYVNYLQKQITYIDNNLEQNRFVLAKLVLTPIEYTNFNTISIENSANENRFRIECNEIPAKEQQHYISRCIIL